VRMRNRYILYYYYSSSDTEGVPSGVRMRNRKLSVPALFSCILTGNDEYSLFILQLHTNICLEISFLAQLCELLPSLGVRRPSVNFLKHILL
jgi:hypothetical protein